MTDIKRSCCSFAVRTSSKMKKKKKTLNTREHSENQHMVGTLWERWRERELFECSMWLMAYGMRFVNTVDVILKQNATLAPVTTYSYRTHILFSLVLPSTIFFLAPFAVDTLYLFGYLIFNSFVNIYVEIILLCSLFSGSSSRSMHVCIRTDTHSHSHNK